MQKAILSSVLFLAALASLGCVEEISSSPSVPDKDLVSLAQYRQWTLVNPTPELMEPMAAISCVRIPGRDEPSPHLHKYVSVFVNPVGREAMMTKLEPKFPVGSMIIKEKLGKPDSTTPEVLTAMIKRETGYNPDNGDWEYLVLNGPASTIVERGKLTRCSDCHSAYKRTDFVTRTYLPNTVARELK